MSNNSLRFANLSDRHPGITPGISAGYGEAACICLGRHHASPAVVLLRDGGAESRATAKWDSPDERMKNGWANEIDATEAGAYGLALAAAELTRGMVAVRRAETKSGADYYLGSPGHPTDDLETSLRLEVSGVDKGNEAAIQARLRQKLDQAANGNSNVPAIATVVGFAALTIVTADVDSQ